jgi:hypothetical protein
MNKYIIIIAIIISVLTCKNITTHEKEHNQALKQVVKIAKINQNASIYKIIDGENEIYVTLASASCNTSITVIKGDNNE